MVVDDIMEHIKTSHPAIEAALDKTRAMIAREYSRPAYHKIRLSPSEVASSIDDVLVGDFFERYPHYRDLNFTERTQIIKKLDRFKDFLYRTQYSPNLKDVVQQFRFECRLVAEQYHAAADVFTPLLRCLDRASAGPVQLDEHVQFLKGHAVRALDKLHEDFDPVVVRLMLEIADYCDKAVPLDPKILHAATRNRTSSRPANDNGVVALAWSR